jgi:glutamate-1-semialdehyde 2,1-aminomutase
MEELYARAREVFPGGVTAAVRANAALGHPFFAARGYGPYVEDGTGNRYIDLNTSFGATLLGHGHPAVRRAAAEALERGVLCSFEVPQQAEVAETVARCVPSIEQLRFTLSGTETTWHAVRTARAFTGREKVVKFEGHYHGLNDYLGVSIYPPPHLAGPDDEPATVPESAGVPAVLAEYTIVLPFNDPDALERTLRRRSGEIAAVICEPVAHNSGTLEPRPGFLETLRSLTAEQGIVLIFDEILSGFRTGVDCLQGYYGVTPDLCTIGKSIGGGLPLCAFGGKRTIMESVAPMGRAIHTGTFNAHPVSIAGAAAFFGEVTRPDFYPSLLAASERLWSGLREIFARRGIRARVPAVGARGSILFGIDEGAELVNHRQSAVRDVEMLKRFCQAAHDRGVHIHPGWHLGLSSAHTLEVVEDTLDRLDAAASSMAG